MDFGLKNLYFCEKDVIIYIENELRNKADYSNCFAICGSIILSALFICKYSSVG